MISLHTTKLLNESTIEEYMIPADVFEGILTRRAILKELKNQINMKNR
ncbi:hypothetical protein [Metabacillus idriensis]|nr:hypothetical protein [Metabacillus idriensis]